MNKLLLTGGAVIAIWSLVHAPAFADPVVGTASEASRKATCRADCSPQGMHGHYRKDAMENPGLMDKPWGTVYAECVRTCLAPLPPFYVQRPILETGGLWFGQPASSCMTCHAKGPNLNVPLSDWKGE